MSPTPTGRITCGPSGRDLVLTRSFKAPIEDVWASVTKSERTARWFGSWSGEAGPGRTISFQMTMEGDVPPSEMLIVACEPPRRLEVRASDVSGSWHLELLLSAAGETTELTFIHHLDSEGDVGDIGPGWEYYLDLLDASREGAPKPLWDDYYPAQSGYYREAAVQGEPGHG